jgi:hypothetical protein
MITYKKIGGLHFLRIGRVGFSWFVSKKKVAPRVLPGTVTRRRLTLAQQKKARAEHLEWCNAMSRGN